MTYVSHRTATDLGIRGTVQKLVDAVTAKVRQTLAGMKARHECRQMLDCEANVLRDVGVTRADIRLAYHEVGHGR